MASVLALQDGITLIVLPDGITPILLAGDQEVFPSLLEALRRRAEQTVELDEALPGGIWTGPPDEGADEDLPYLVLSWIGEQVVSYVTGNTSPDDHLSGPRPAGWRTQIQASLVGDDYDVLEQIHETWQAAIHSRMKPLSIRRRRLRGLVNHTARVDHGTVPLPSGYNSVVIHWDMDIVTNAVYQE